jgi:hypothetical protein
MLSVDLFNEESVREKSVACGEKIREEGSMGGDIFEDVGILRKTLWSFLKHVGDFGREGQHVTVYNIIQFQTSNLSLMIMSPMKKTAYIRMGIQLSPLNPETPVAY